MVRILKFILSRAEGALLHEFAAKLDEKTKAKRSRKRKNGTKAKIKVAASDRVRLEFTAMQHFTKIIASRPFSAHFMRHAMGSLSEQESFVLAKIVVELVLKQTPSVLGKHVTVGTPKRPSIGQLLEFMSIILDSNFPHLTSLAGDGRDRDRYAVLRQQLQKLLDVVHGEMNFLSRLSELKQLVSGIKTLKDTPPVHGNHTSDYSIETILIEKVLL